MSRGADTKANTLGAAAHLRLVIFVSLRTAASAVAPSAPMPLHSRLRARGGMGAVREQACQWAIDTAAFTASRLGNNNIGGHHDNDGEFVYNTEGIIALCEALKGSAVTSLECAAAPKCLPFCQRPLTCLLTLPPPIPYSLGGNDIGAQGASALAAILKETQITNLECAAAPEFAFVSAPVDTPVTSPFPLCSSLTVWGAT